MGELDVDALASRLTPQQLDAWIASGALDLPNQLALGFAGVCRTFGAKVTPEMFLMEQPEPLSVRAFEANLAQFTAQWNTAHVEHGKPSRQADD